PLMLGLAGGGLALTAASYASFSAAVPARAGLSLVKAGRRAGSIGAPFLASFRVLTKDGMVRLGRDVAAIRDTAGTRAALDALKLAQRPRDVAALARIAENQGSRTRAILKVAGRGALTLGALAFDLASWLFGAVVTLIGFCAAVKRAAERATERYLFRRKLRRLRAVAPT
ncbi:MAG: hypothetical protein HY056_13300, partial [Proteobacteria bacterium]|nr:hypothetical protein [Pseudomonadota bacterium]